MEPVSRAETIEGTDQWQALAHKPVVAISGPLDVRIDITGDGTGWVRVPTGMTAEIKYETEDTNAKT